MQAVHTDGLLESVPVNALVKNLECVRKTLEQNRRDNCKEAKLIAVTKTVSPSVISDLAALGVSDIAENRVQVALSKLPAIPPQLRLHWIGRLQTNKVRYIVDRIALLHSLDRMDLAAEVDRRAQERGLTVDSLVQVNIAGEIQKAGMAPEQVLPFLRSMRDYPGIRIRGLMAIMPVDADENQLHILFSGMRELFEHLREEAPSGVEMTELSMGMSRDYAIAAQEGSTMVRVGTALYRS